MSTDRFEISEHVVPGCHIREYPGSTAGHQEEVLHLHVKQYSPKDQLDPVPSDAITFIAAHAIGFPKELYEPLWDELWELSKQYGFHIRGIWITDAVGMGMSGVLNEDKLSMDYSWMDHSRDLLSMINHFRDQMPRPFVGIGHSFGGTIMTNLAYLHPRLFTTLILLDPGIQLNPPKMGFGTDPPTYINAAVWRNDIWPNRAAAAASQKRFFPDWDPRCTDLMIRHGFRDLPTPLYPDITKIKDADPTNPPVTLTTTKHQDTIALMRENFSSRQPDGRIKINQTTHADLDPFAASIPLYRPEPRSTFNRVATLRPSALFLIGGKTIFNIDELRAAIKICGTGVGGSGGIMEEKVKEVTFPHLSHFFPFEGVRQTAEQCALWLQQEMKRFRDAEKEWNDKRRPMSKRDHMVLHKEWFRVVKPPVTIKAGKQARKNKL
ncbi:hypothetical protein BO70DRAFT_196423 [Aspergillus heteromorphus CBS 117.55]|uniref:AB hydrolase-1 domain-containing protein n=1 Tax=Aspergillus heteromorphus CBS 117.55 TaxID=1448321 RepID=A0A317WNH1_9EURO|nr:uncharacterized protein BO70DRAFT_196423 [Aspergillus heteromorphus CBS 117.55]PWY87545.1 hypothetical protein BO70DRAFT_196423 [Aspergillus heteromorphus CBS 117.55]